MENLLKYNKNSVVLKKFSSKGKNFWIQIIEDQHIEDVMNGLFDHFYTGEPISSYSKVIEKPNFVEKSKVMYQDIIKQGISLVCLTDVNENLEVTGFLCLETTQYMKDSKYPRNSQDLLEYLLNSRTKYCELDVSEYIVERGLCVLPNWRGFGISCELMKCWSTVCKSLNLNVGVGIFSSKFSQAAAARAGLVLANSITYENLKNIFPQYTPEGIEEHTKTLDLYLVVA